MPSRVVLEICVESTDRAIAAERGGAHRIELCSDLSCGGLTPSAGLIDATRQQVRIPIHVLIRPRAGDFCYSSPEFEIVARDIRAAKDLRVDGIVLGILNPKGQIDISRTRKLVELARPLPVTFHRAFDLCRDKDGNACLEAVIQTGAARILTSAGKDRVVDGITRIANLVRASEKRIAIMPGGGVNAENVQQILQQTGAPEIHASLGSADATRNTSAHEFEGRVRRVRDILEAMR
jgi:copper homeostasis protein